MSQTVRLAGRITRIAPIQLAAGFLGACAAPEPPSNLFCGEAFSLLLENRESVSDLSLLLPDERGYVVSPLGIEIHEGNNIARPPSPGELFLRWSDAEMERRLVKYPLDSPEWEEWVPEIAIHYPADISEDERTRFTERVRRFENRNSSC